MEMTSCLFRKDVPRPRSVSARCRDARVWKTCPRPVTGSLLLEHTRHCTPPTPTSPHTGTVPRALQTHTTPHKHISTHTTHPDTKTPTTHASPHTSPRHISTHATVAAHTYVPCVHGYTHTQKHTQTHMVIPNLDADNHSSHIHSGRGRAAGTEKKPQVLECII